MFLELVPNDLTKLHVALLTLNPREVSNESKPCFSPNPRKQQLEHGITITTVVDSIEGDLHSLRQDESYKKANEHL